MTDASLRQRVLAELRERNVHGVTVVPEQRSSIPGLRQVNGVIVTDKSGQRFRLLETHDLVTLDEDTSPQEVCATWLRVEGPLPLADVVAAMIRVMQTS
ncbi:MAG: hypothetical protein JST00_01775 [Deltaproteobacteria bacterium]|nr:hypothetical protein [Deltaproteobacteria bacterium]